MRIVLLSLIIIFCFGCDEPNLLIIKNANLLDIENGKSETVNLFIKDGIIEKITNDSISNKVSIDLKGQYIVPTLYDMHVHLHDSVSFKMEDYRKYGVFSVRDMGIFKNENKDNLSFYQGYRIEEYSTNGVHPVGYIYNGKECQVDEHYVIDSKSDLIEAIKLIKSANLKFFKIHNCFPNDLLDELIELSKEYNLKIVGHIPQGIDPKQYCEYEISSIEHIDSFIRGLFSREDSPAQSFKEVIDILDGPYLDSLAMNLKRNKIALTPTLVTYENFVKSAPKEQQASGYVILRKLQSYTKRFHDSGVQILIGTDYPLSGLSIGDSLIREMELLIESGLNANEVLLIAIKNSANYLEESHQIKEGYKANFVVLKENPLTNLSTFREVKSTMVNGKFTKLNN